MLTFNTLETTSGVKKKKHLVLKPYLKLGSEWKREQIFTWMDICTQTGQTEREEVWSCT